MKANEDKCHLIVSTNELAEIQIGDFLNAYGFSLSAVKQMQSYLSERKQRTKINQSYSSWEKILIGPSQESILGPILFNIFPSDVSHSAKC